MKKVISKLLITLLVSMLCLTNISINVLAEDEPINENPTEEVLPVAEPLEEDEPLDNFIDDLQGENQDEEGIEPQEVNDRFDITSYFTESVVDLEASASIRNYDVNLYGNENDYINFSFYSKDEPEIKVIDPKTNEESNQLIVNYNKIEKNPLLMQALTGASNGEPILSEEYDFLEDYLFTFNKVDGKYLISAKDIDGKGDTVYLSFVNSPTSTVETSSGDVNKFLQTVTIDDNGLTKFKNKDGKILYFFKDGNFTFNRYGDYDIDQCKFYLVKVETIEGNTKYTIETSLPEDGSKYLICSKYNNDYYFLRPRCGSSYNMVGKFAKKRKKDNYEAQVTIKYFTEDVSVEREIVIYDGNDDTKPSVINVKINQQKIRNSNPKETANTEYYIPKGSINRIYVDDVLENIILSHSNVFNKIVNNGFESYAAEYNYISVNGTYSDYNTNLKPLSEATFNASIIAKYRKDGTRLDVVEENVDSGSDPDLTSAASIPDSNSVSYIRLFASSKNGVYLHPSSHYIDGIYPSNTTNNRKSVEIREIEGVKGEFTVKGDTNYLAFRKKVDWGVFYSKNTTSVQDDNKESKNDCNIVIYKKDSSRTNNDSSIPGYRRIMNLSEIKDGDELLFTSICNKPTNNHIYIVNPAGLVSSFLYNEKTFRNSEVLVSKEIHTEGNTILDIAGVEIGSDTITLKDDKTVKINVVDAPNESNIGGMVVASNGNKISNIVAGPYMLLAVKANESSGTETNNVKSWFSTDENVLTVRKSYNDYALITTKFNNNEAESEAYIGYIANDNSVHYLKVNVVNTNNAKVLNKKPSYLSGYVEELKNSEVSYVLMNQVDQEYTKDDFHSVYEKTQLYLPCVTDASGNYGINFYSRSIDEDHVLAYIRFDGSDSHYFRIGGETFEKSEAYEKSNISGNFACTEKNNFNNAFKNQVEKARELNYYAVAGFTRAGDNVSFGSVKIVSESLPTISKTVSHIIRNNERYDYEDGFEVQQNDEIYFDVTVKRDALTTGMSETEGYFNFESTLVKDILPYIEAKEIILKADGSENHYPLSETGENLSVGDYVVKRIKNKDNSVSLEIEDILNKYEIGKDIEIHIMFVYRVKDSSTDGDKGIDIANIAKGNPIINTVQMTNKVKSKYNLDKTIESDSTARAVLTISSREIFKYMNLSLSDDVKLNIYVDLSPYSDNVNFWRANGYKMGVEFEDGTKAYAKFPDEYYQGSEILNSEHLYKFTVSVPPKYIGDNLKLYVVTGTYDRITVPVVTSMKTYANNLINDEKKSDVQGDGYLTELVKKYNNTTAAIEGAQKLQLVLASMLNYAKEAQIYTGYHTGKLANDGINNSSKLYNSNSTVLETLEQKIKSYKTTSTIQQVNECETVDIIGMNMAINSLSELRIYFKTKEVSINDLEVINRHLVSDRRTDTIYAIDTNMSTFIGQNEYGYYVSYDNLSIQNLSSVQKLTLKYTDKAGKTSEDSLVFTVLDYINRLPEGDAKNLMTEMYNFGLMIREYYGVKGALTNNRGVN